MLICAIDSLFVLENPNCTKPTQIILVFKKQSPSVCIEHRLSIGYCRYTISKSPLHIYI